MSLKLLDRAFCAEMFSAKKIEFTIDIVSQVFAIKFQRQVFTITSTQSSLEPDHTFSSGLTITNNCFTFHWLSSLCYVLLGMLCHYSKSKARTKDCQNNE